MRRISSTSVGETFLAAGDDDVLRASGEEEVAVGVAVAEIAGVEPAVFEHGIGRGGGSIVARHHGRSADDDVARGARLGEAAVGTPHGNDHVRVRPADGSLAVEDARAARHGDAIGGLGLPVGLDHLGAREDACQGALRLHRRRAPADAHLTDGVADFRRNAAHRDDVEDHAADEERSVTPKRSAASRRRGGRSARGGRRSSRGGCGRGGARRGPACA
jgi:hypothetical protein